MTDAPDHLATALYFPERAGCSAPWARPKMPVRLLQLSVWTVAILVIAMMILMLALLVA